MRLIDAENLKLNISANTPIFAQGMVRGFCCIVDNAKTVDAIPIWWIKEWINEIYEHPNYNTDERLLLVAELEDMLCGWESEQAEKKEE